MIKWQKQLTFLRVYSSTIESVFRRAALEIYVNALRLNQQWLINIRHADDTVIFANSIEGL